MSSDPLAGRPGLQTEKPEDNPLARELGQLMRRHGLRGVMMISFTEERVGVNSSGATDKMAAAMEQLGNRVLADLDDGKYDPTTHLN